MTQTIYQAAGGADGMVRLAQAWHERVMADWVLAIDDLGFRDPLRQVLIDYWVAGVARMNEHPDTPDTVQDGLTIPHWSWEGPVAT